MTSFHSSTPRNCPPNDASSPDGVFLRLVLNNPPTSEDFLIWALEPRNHHLVQKRRNKNCREYAISVFKTMDGIHRVLGLFRRGTTKRAKVGGRESYWVAHVQLDASAGLIKQTGNDLTHHDLWPYLSCKIETCVISVEGVEHATN